MIPSIRLERPAFRTVPVRSLVMAGSRNRQSANHVCSPELSKGFVGEVVWSLFPYFNLTEN